MEISGVIDSIEKFESVIDEIRKRRAYTQAHGLPHRQEYFRGQLSSDWSIKPSLTRDLKTADQVRNTEKKVLEFFSSQIKEKNYLDKIFLHEKPNGYQNDWLWISQAQHYGIPTRLLDWTAKPEVALYFAVDNAQFDHLDGQILALFIPNEIIKTEGREFIQYYDTKPDELTETWFLNPSFFWHDKYNEATGEIRRARQFGKFTLQPCEKSLLGFDKQTEFLKKWDQTFDPVIEKYIIPAHAKPQIRLELVAKGWHGEWLYANDDEIINHIRDNCKQLLFDEIKKLK